MKMQPSMFIVDLRNASFRQPGLQSVPQRVRKQIIFCETNLKLHQYDAVVWNVLSLFACILKGGIQLVMPSFSMFVISNTLSFI